MPHWLLYIDPGSGSYLVQVIVAAALGVAFFFRNIKNSIKAFFTRSPKKPNDNQKA
jgi:ATP-dependent Zn protease